MTCLQISVLCKRKTKEAAMIEGFSKAAALNK